MKEFDSGKKSVVKPENRPLIIRQLVFIDLYLIETYIGKPSISFMQGNTGYSYEKGAIPLQYWG